MSDRLQQVSSLDGSRPEIEEFSLLRHLVLGEEQHALRLVREQVAYLERILKRQELRLAQALSTQEKRLSQQAGPHALAWLSQRVDLTDDHDRIGHELAAPLLATLRISASQHREALARALSPVLIPCLRFAIGDFFRRGLERFDSLAHAFNFPQRLYWRIASRQQGIPYADYLQQRTARFQVLQVQLIDKFNGETLCQLGDSTAPLPASIPDWHSHRISGAQLILQIRTFGSLAPIIERRSGEALFACEQQLGGMTPASLTPQHLTHFKHLLLTLMQMGATERRNPWLGILLLIAALVSLSIWCFRRLT